MKKILLIALAFAATALSAQAESLFNPYRDVRSEAVPPGITLQKLFNLNNDRKPEVFHRLSLMIDTNNLAAGIYSEELPIADQGLFSPTDGISWLRDIESTQGAVLFEGQGKKVILLQGKLDRATQEGRFNIRFMTNGLSGNYEACDMLLKKDDKGWFIQNAYTNKKITDAKIITWSLGVTTIQGVCPKKD